MKTLVADKFEDLGLNGLRKTGCEVIYQPGLKDDELQNAIAQTQCAVLIVRSAKVTEPIMTKRRCSVSGPAHTTVVS